jgi:hypothetical protein
METFSAFSCTPYLSLELWNRVKIIIFIFERSIRAEVVTYHYDAAFGSLHTQQLHGFDELCNDQGIIRNCSAKINTTVKSSQVTNHQ